VVPVAPRRRRLQKQRTQSARNPGGSNLEHNPIDQMLQNRLANLRSAPRCGAKNRAGNPCLCPAIRGRRRCRIHGGRSTGAPRGPANGNYTDGAYTLEAKEERRWLRELIITFAKTEDAK
jgi:hypothetical protein